MFILFMIAFTLLVLSFFLLSLCSLISKKSINWREKFLAFECGFDFFSYPRLPFSMRFFLIAIIFIIFDVEIVIILPLISTMLKSNIFKWCFTSILFFFILVLGIFLEWKEESFNWKFY